MLSSPPGPPPAPCRRHALLAGLALAACPLASASSSVSPRRETDPATLPGTSSLTLLIGQAAARGEPVVVMFSRVDCVWCAALRRDQLSHLARAAPERGVRVVEFDVNDTRKFSPGPSKDGGPGAAVSGADLADRLGVRLTPTVVFLGPRGELADRLVGYPSRDFYGAYLDERIEQARTALRTGRPATQ